MHKVRLRHDLDEPYALIYGYGQYFGRVVGSLDSAFQAIDWEKAEWDCLQPDCLGTGLNDGEGVNMIIAHNNLGVFYVNSLDFEDCDENE